MITPADICQRALDAIGAEVTIADPDLADGTREAEAARRIYGPTLRQLLRAAPWNFARRQATLTLLQDATGQTTQNQQRASMPITVGTGTPGMGPWLYEYAWPIDCVRARYVPQTVTPPPQTPIPLMPTLPATAAPAANIPARFVVSQDMIPNLLGNISDWNELPDLNTTLGQGIGSQSVILTNVFGASLVYTGLVTFPGEWDHLFEQAMVAVLAERLAMPVLEDKKFALAMRAQQVVAARAALDAARISDGDEGWFTVNREASWIDARRRGGRWNSWGPTYPWGDDGPGVLAYGWSVYGFSDGSAY